MANKKWRIVAGCEGCARVQGQSCAVIDEPIAWHRRGRCTAWTDDAEWAAKCRAAVEAYSRVVRAV